MKKTKLEREVFKSIHMDLEKKEFSLNGEPMPAISSLSLEFNNGKWRLIIEKSVVYDEESAPEQ